MPPHPDSGFAKPRLLDQVRIALRTRRYSKSTETAYVSWIRRFIVFHGKRHPDTLGARHLAAFLSHLASARNVSASTQNQALAAILFLYREVLDRDLGWVEGVVRARSPVRRPVVLTHEEVRAILDELSGKARLIVMLLYGSGLRIGECLALRIKDVDFEARAITVIGGKGNKDRISLLPQQAIPALRRQMEDVRRLFQADLDRGYGEASIPQEVEHRQPEAGRQWAWQFVFPRMRLKPDRACGRLRREPLDDQFVQRAVRDAVLRAGIAKPVTCHTFRHAFASHLLASGVDIRTVQTLLGHRDVETTMIYTHVLAASPTALQSPMDRLENDTLSPGTADR